MNANEENSNELNKPLVDHKVKIFGVGGAGCRTIDSLRKKNNFSAEYYFVNDEQYELDAYIDASKICIGTNKYEKRTYEHGKNTGSKFKKGIEHIVDKADLVVIVAGIGGGIGSGSSVTIAEIAKENKIPTVAVVCSPFSFEGKTRNNNAEKSLNSLRALGVPTIVVPCENIKSIVPKTTAMRDAIQLAQTMVINALNTLLVPILSSSAVNLDFIETLALLRKSNNIYFGYGESGGKERTIEAVRYAVNCPMADSAFKNVTGIISYIEGGEDLTLDEVTEVATLMRAATDSSVNIMFASNISSELTGKIKVSILATKPNIKAEVVSTRGEVSKCKSSRCYILGAPKNHSTELTKILDAAICAAKEYGSSYVASEHLIYAMLDNECIAGEVLKVCKVNVVKYEDLFKRSIDKNTTIKGVTPRTKYIVEQAGIFARDIDGDDATAGTEHLLLAIISSPECLAMRILKAIGVDLQKLASTLEKVLRADE